MRFSNRCHARPVTAKTDEHESAGVLHYGHGVRFILVGLDDGSKEDVVLNVCKWCSCVYAEKRLDPRARSKGDEEDER